MRLAALLLCAGLAACTSVVVPEPLGDTPVTAQSEQWNGLWLGNGDGVLYVVVVNEIGGQLEVGLIGEEKSGKEESKLQFNRFDVFLRKAGDTLLASVRPSDASGRARRDFEGYAFFAFRKNGDEVIFWLPDHKCVETQVKKGILSGTVVTEGSGMFQGKTITLEPLSTVSALSRTSNDCSIFPWREPVVIRRMTRR